MISNAWNHFTRSKSGKPRKRKVCADDCIDVEEQAKRYAQFMVSKGLTTLHVFPIKPKSRKPAARFIRAVEHLAFTNDFKLVELTPEQMLDY